MLNSDDPHPDLRGCIFDMDGTLINTLPDISRSMNTILTSRGFPEHEMEAFKDFVGSGLRTTMQRALGENYNSLAEEEFSMLFQEVMQEYSLDPARGSLPYKGIENLLDILAAWKIPASVLSNKTDSLTKRIAAQRLSKWKFVDIIGLLDEKTKKPNPVWAFHMAERMSLAAQEIAFVGDSDVDMQTARTAGMFPVGVSWGFQPPERLIEAGAALVLENPEDAEEFLELFKNSRYNIKSDMENNNK